MYLPNHGKRNTTRPASIESSTEAAERRRHRRRSGAWAGQLQTMQGARVRCVILDLSPGGAKLLLEKSVEKSLLAGELVTFETERFGTHRGRVAWTAGARAGLAFMEFGAVDASAVALTDKPEFLRGRAEVLRRLAQTARSGDTVAGLLWTAKGFEEAAQRIEAQAKKSLAIVRSIRKEDALFARSQPPVPG